MSEEELQTCLAANKGYPQKSGAQFCENKFHFLEEQAVNKKRPQEDIDDLMSQKNECLFEKAGIPNVPDVAERCEKYLAMPRG